MRGGKHILMLAFLFFFVNSFSQEEEGFFDGCDKMTYCLMEKAERQIEEIRKGNFVLTFTDESGSEINVPAVMELKAHEFDFGTNLYGFHSMDDSDPGKVTSLRAIDTLFNTVIACDYWSINQPKLDGSLFWASPDYGYNIAEQMNKKPRHHALIYGFPRWLHNYETEEQLWGVIEARIKHIADRYGDQIVEVDVINEFINYQYWENNANAIYLKTTQFPDFAKAENGVRVLQIARKHLPNAKLVVLETGTWSANNPIFQEIYQYHKSLIELGAPAYYIGYQAHYYAQGLPFEEGTPSFGPRTYMMDEINKGIEQMSRLGLPILISEFNPPSRNNKNTDPDQPSLTDEEIATWESNFYTLMFSKPYMTGLSRWFTIDNLGGRGMDAGIVTEGGVLKPNYFALRQLIKEKWHTRWEGNLSDDVRFRGFYGSYEIQAVGYENVTIHLSAENREQTVVLHKE